MHNVRPYVYSRPWSTVINDSLGTESSYLGFYDKVEDILNHMAPYRKMPQRNVRLEQRPWITHGRLVSMNSPVASVL